MVEYKFKLCHLDCANCAKKIEEELQKKQEYSQVQVSFATSTIKLKTELEENLLKQKLERDIKKVEPDVTIIEKKKKIDYFIVRMFVSTILFLLGLLIPSMNFLFLISYVIIGYDIIIKSVKNIIQGKLFDEFFLMTLATICAFIIGKYAEGVAVMLFFQIGEFIQAKAVQKSRSSITSLLNLKSDYANLIVDNVTRKVNPEYVQVGDEVLLKPGEKIPLDGIIIDGRSTIDTSMLTGESLPRNVSIDDEVYAGCINLSGLLKLKVKKKSSDSMASKIMEMIENAASKKTNTERFITKFSKIYTPTVVVLAIVLCLVPVIFFHGNFNDWLYRSLVFLVISCPCALVISIPLGFFSGIGLASKEGILLKGSDALEQLTKIDTLVFDKTGTITKGNFVVTSVVTDKNKNTDLVVEYAGVAEQFSNHPIAKAIIKRAGKDYNKKEVEDYEEIAGKGVKVTYKKELVVVGNKKLMEQEQIEVPDTNTFGTVVYVARNKEYMGYLVVEDQVKDEIDRTLIGLRKLGIHKFAVVSGDSKKIVSNVCRGIGIQDYYSEILPIEKAEIVKNMMLKHKVCFVGDGINDALVLTEADLGISMGGIGSDAATIASDIVIMDDDISKIVSAIKIAKRTERVVWTNIIFALCIKFVVLGLGLLGLTPIWLAVFADVGVTLLTILNTILMIKQK